MHSQDNLIKFVESWKYNIIFYISYVIYILHIVSSGLNQIILIIYTTKLETFLLDHIFKKWNIFSSNYQINLTKITDSKF